MVDLLGLTALLLVAGFTLVAVAHWPAIARVLLVAFLVRAGAALFHYYIAPLPDGTTDAVSFERQAWEWAQSGFYGWAELYTGMSSYFISWVIAFFYTVTDRSPLMAQAISLFFGMGTVVLGWRLAFELWDERAAKRAAWVLTFFPTLVLYSALTMREAYIWFFLVLAMLGVLRWARTGRLSAMIMALFGFAGATFFHGAMVIGAVAFLVLAALRALVLSSKAIFRHRIRLAVLLVVLFAGGAISLFVSGAFSVPKLGTMQDAADAERIISRVSTSTRDTAAYPSWTMPNTTQEIFWKVPVRGAYFLFSPFPWDVRGLRHLIGLFDGFLYMGLAFLIWRNRKLLWADPGGRFLLLVVGAMVLVFGVAIGNFGTGIRHRAKFVAILIVLAAPSLPRLVFGKTKGLASGAGTITSEVR